MAKHNAFEDLMRAVDAREKSGAAGRDRDAEAHKKRKEHERAMKAENERREREGKDATGARVRRGFTNMQEMRDAINSEKASGTLGAPKKQNPRGGVRG